MTDGRLDSTWGRDPFRRVLVDAVRLGLDPGLAQRAHAVALQHAASEPGVRAAALAALGLPPQVVAALAQPAAWARPQSSAPPGVTAPTQVPGQGFAQTAADGSVRLRASGAMASPLADTVRARGPRPGGRVGPFTIVSELGRGGMGVVLKAQADDGRVVAVKVLTDPGATGPTKRFEREAKALAALDHPNVVGFVDASDGPPPWIAMAFVEGQDLAQRLERGPLPPDEVARVVGEVARGVAHAHARGIVHRDLKPSNVLLRAQDGRAVVTDFGLAKGEDASRYTKTGAMLGTLSYMSPEQVRGDRAAGPKADVWALGAILFRCLTGRDPFEGETAMELAARIVDGKAPTARSVDADAPEDLDATIAACLQRDPAARPSAEALADALEARAVTGESALEVRGTARAAGGGSGRAVLALVGLLVVGGLAAAAGLAAGGSRPQTQSQLQPPTASAPPPTTPTEPALTEPAPTTPTEPAPPPAEAPPAWRRAWSLTDGPAPELRPPALWEEPGRVVAPVERLETGDPTVVAAAFAGRARRLPDGRFHVRYDDLRLALIQVSTVEPARLVALGSTVPLEAVVCEPGDPGRSTLRAPAGSDFSATTFGRVAWREPRMTLRLRAARPLEGEALVALLLGDDQAEEKGVVRLAWDPRGLTLLAGRPPREGAPLGAAWTTLELAPTAPAGERILVDGAAMPALDEAIGRAAAEGMAPGFVGVLARGVDLELEGAELTGFVESTEVAALAYAPPEVPGAARVEVRCRPAVGEGGVFLALEAPGEEGLRLVLKERRLILVAGDRPLGVVPRRDRPRGALPREGTLRLEVEGDRIRARWDDGDERLGLEVLHPLPLPFGPGRRAGYGATSRRVRFEAATLDVGPAAPARRALDEAWARGDLEAALRGLERSRAERAGAARTGWRLGALQLARAIEPTFAAPELVGPTRRPARVAAARAALETLEAACERVGLEDDAGRDAPGSDASPLDPGERADLQARAVVAAIVAGDATRAAALARRLVAAEGGETSRGVVDALERGNGAPVLLSRLARGWLPEAELDGRIAGWRASLVLDPRREGEVAVALANGLQDEDPRPPPPTPERRAVLEECLALLARAKAAGVPEKARDPVAADLYLELGDAERAYECVERIREWAPMDPHVWACRAMCCLALGRPVDAVISQLLHARVAPPVDRAEALKQLVLLVQDLDRTAPGLAAAVLVACAEVGPRAAGFDAAEVARLRALALERAELAPGAGPEADLAAYARRCLGDPTPPAADVEGAERTTAVLFRARRGDAEDRARLKSAAEEDSLVGTLASLDPDLAPLLSADE